MKNFLKTFVRTEKFCVLLLAAVAVAVLLPVLIKGVPFGYDLPHHYQCAMTFVESLSNGDFYPSWSAIRNFGFGGMETRLYPPVSHYSLALFYIVAGDWHIASFLTFTFFTFLGGLGVYLWAKEYMPAGQAVFAGCFFNLMPYHLNQLYNTFFYAEFVGTALLPFVFLFVSRVCRRGRAADILGLAVSFAVLILTHLPLTVIGSLCFALYGLTLLKREKIAGQLAGLGIGALGGIAASSFFWTKVLLEKDLMAKTLVYADPWLDYRLHFLLTPLQSFEGELETRIYETATFFYDLMFLYPVIAVFACSIPFYLWEKRRRRAVKSIWLIFGIAALMAIPPSRPIWDAVSIIQEVQFPWRWLAIVSITAPVIAAAQINFLVDWFQDKKRPLALIIAGCLLATVAFSVSQIVRQAPFIEKETVAGYMEKNQTDIGFTFWWTIWTRKEAFDNRDKVSAGSRKAEINKWAPTEKEFQISAGETGTARVALFYHPNWTATVNQTEIAPRPDENGAMIVDIPNAKSTVLIKFVEPTAVKIGQWLSFAMWLCFLALALTPLLKKIRLRSLAAKPSGSGDFWKVLLKAYHLTENRSPFVILFAASLLTILPMILIGVFNGGDLYQHIQLASSFQTSIAEGKFYPSWGAVENTGYGSLGVRFYPPAVPFLLGATRLLTNDWHIANCLVFLFFTFAGSLGIYYWAKEYLPPAKAVWAGIIFIFVPYHLIEIHNASMYAEFAGVSVITFSFLFITRLCRGGGVADVLGLAIAFGLLVLTHLPSTVIGAPCLLVYALFNLPKGKISATLAKLATAVFFGVGASAIYWSRMVFERDWVRMTKFWHDDHFDYRINFLLTSPWVDTRQLWFFNLVLISMVVVAAGAVVGIYYKKRAEDRLSLRGIIIVFFGAIFMTTVFSYPLWATVPFLPEVQFPWRWLTVASVNVAVLAAVGIDALLRLKNTSLQWNKAVKGFVVTVILFFSVIYGLIWIGYQLNYIPSREYETWSAAKSREMGAEWFWTIYTKKEAFEVKEKILAGDRTAEIILWSGEERVFTVEAGNAAEARVATLFYPNWQATVNEQPVELKIAEDGVILVPLPSQEARVRLWFSESPRVLTAIYVSLTTWLVLLSGLFFIFLRKFSANL